MTKAKLISDTQFPVSAIDGSTDASLFTCLDGLRSQGYVILNSITSERIINAVTRELGPWFEATPRCQGNFYGWNTTRFGSLLTKSPSSHALILNQQILDLVGATLNPHCDYYQLNLTQAVRIHPGERQQVPHRDEEMWPCHKGGINYLVNVLWALDDFTAENGATRLWPRSQFKALDRSVSPIDMVIAEMPRGSALVFLGSITHGGGANITTQPRTGVIVSYCLGWLRQYENQYLAYPPEIAQTFPKALCDLIGYRIHRPNLGGHEGQDPSVLFHGPGHALSAVDALPEATRLELEAYYET